MWDIWSWSLANSLSNLLFWKRGRREQPLSDAKLCWAVRDTQPDCSKLSSGAGGRRTITAGSQLGHPGGWSSLHSGNVETQSWKKYHLFCCIRMVTALQLQGRAPATKEFDFVHCMERDTKASAPWGAHTIAGKQIWWDKSATFPLRSAFSIRNKRVEYSSRCFKPC